MVRTARLIPSALVVAALAAALHAASVPPGAPLDLAASVAGSSVTLSWLAPASGGSPSTYVLEAGSFPGGANLANFATGSLATSFSAGGVPPGVYYARVRARNDAGTSAASNEVSFTIGATPCTPPGTPGSLSASISGFSVTLTWNAPPSGGVPTTYLIEAGSSSGGTDLATFATGSTATSFTGTAGPGTFFVRVRARNACGTSGPSNEVLVATPAPPGGRTTIDRPDEVSGCQGKVMYVLPSDGVDQALDTNGTLRTSVAAFQRWLERESGQRVRMDTFGGALDTTFVRLGRSDAVLKSFGVFVRDEIQRDLHALGFNHPQKIYAVYYGGGSTVACGGGAWPPVLVGNVAALYLNGTPPGSLPCSVSGFAPSEGSPGYWEFAMLHEIVHTVGLAATCAPNHTLAGHVSDDPRDLMWAGPLPWRPSLLDVNRNDYYAHGTVCLDGRTSSFMTPTVPGATPPPGWPGGPALTLPFERAPGDPLRFLFRLLPTGPAR